MKSQIKKRKLLGYYLITLFSDHGLHDIFLLSTLIINHYFATQ